MKFTIVLLLHVFLLISLSFGQTIPEFFQRSIDQEVGIWIADNSGYMNENESYDAYAIEWSYGINKKSLVGRLYGLKDGVEQKTFWEFRKYWNARANKAILSQYGDDGTFGSGPFIKYTSSEHELAQTFIRPDDTSYKTGHRTKILSDSSRVDSSFNINDSGEWILNRSYTWIKKRKSTDNNVYDAELAKAYGADDYGMRKYVMAFLYSGEAKVSKEEASKIQMAHLKNIQRLAEEGKLSLAGPFFGNDELRGIYVFNVSSIKEAEDLTNTDPAIQAGTLKMELKEWYGSAALMGLLELNKRLMKKSITD